MIFNYLAQDPKQHWQFAAKVWKMSGSFDFSYYQLYCDEALLKLGLARHGENGIQYFNDYMDGFEDRPQDAPED